MRVITAKLSIDGKTLHVVFDDDRVCAFSYPLSASVMNDRLSKYAKEVQAWLGLGNNPEQMVEHEPSKEELLKKTDEELINISARTIEDIIQDRINAGEFVAQKVIDKIEERKALRAED